MNNLVFQPMVRTPKNTTTLILGTTGAGKTVAALRLGKGLAGGDFSKVFYIQLDRKDADIYLDDSRFPDLHDLNLAQAVKLEAPYSPPRVEALMGVAIGMGAEVIIVDGYEAVWQDDGGTLQTHASVGGAYTDWNNPAVNPPWYSLLDALTRHNPCHVIVTTKSKMETEVGKPEDGKSRYKVIELGVGACLRKNTEYAFMVRFNLDVRTHQAEVLSANGNIFPPSLNLSSLEITSELGAAMDEWASQGTNNSLRLYGNNHIVDVLDTRHIVTYDYYKERKGEPPYSHTVLRSFFEKNKDEVNLRISQLNGGTNAT